MHRVRAYANQQMPYENRFIAPLERRARLNEQTGRIGAIIRPPREKKEEERWLIDLFEKKKKNKDYTVNLIFLDT